MSSAITISQSRNQFRGSLSPAPPDHDQQGISSDTASDSSSPVEIDHPAGSESEASISGASESEPEEDGDSKRNPYERRATEEPLYNPKGKGKATDTRPRTFQPPRVVTKKRRKTHEQDAVIVLQEEKVKYLFYAHIDLIGYFQANIFHDFLKYVYPQCEVPLRLCG